MALSNDGKTLATGNSNGKIRLWMIATGRQIGKTIPVGRFPNVGLSEFTFSPDDSLLATAGIDGTVRLWDVATQRQVGPKLARGLTSKRGDCARAKPDGRRCQPSPPDACPWWPSRSPRRGRLATSQMTMNTAIAISPMMRKNLRVAKIAPAAVTASQVARIAPRIVPMIRPMSPVCARASAG